MKIEEDMPMFQEPDKDGYVEHICCEGSRRHVISYDSSGEHCSEPNCEMNKPKKKLNIGIIGYAGINKSTLIEELARRSIKEADIGRF